LVVPSGATKVFYWALVDRRGDSSASGPGGFRRHPVRDAAHEPLRDDRDSMATLDDNRKLHPFAPRIIAWAEALAKPYDVFMGSIPMAAYQRTVAQFRGGGEAGSKLSAFKANSPFGGV
jgi:hypothetical protein